MKRIRIFISSPGDVQQERNIAREVIAELGNLYSQYVTLEVLMWEDFPLTVDSTFQEGINYFLEHDVIDVAVFILWSRLGTPLCTKFVKEDGTPYQSGTEYEFELMKRLFLETGAPRILTYVKNSRIQPKDNATIDDLLDARRQEIAVKTFLQEHFHDEESNSNYAYMQFGERASFEQKFRIHITELIKSMLGDVGEICEWEGNPYVGLNSFEYEQKSIFFGRKQLVYETASKLVDIDDETVKKSLIVLGESGSGKSSFIKAGLLPFFCKEESGDGCFTIVTPSMFNGRIYQGLLDFLVSGFDFLENNPFLEELNQGIDEHTNFKHLEYAFAQHKYQDRILFIDQFEELFNDNQITEEERLRTIRLLKGIVSTQKIRVFISMRSDFYNRFSLYDDLAKIKSQCVVIDIPIVGYSDLAEIIEEPARKACLKWEIDNHAVALNKCIIKDAYFIKDLPLIEFGLFELYLLRDEHNCMTFAAYEKIGRLEGAIVTYANSFYSKLNEEEKTVFKDILGFVVAESSSQKGTYVRKTSLRKDLEKSELHKEVIDKLITAHLFVSGKDCNGEATVTITHEILIRSWDVVSEWIQAEKIFLDRNIYYEQLAQYWKASKYSKKNLIKGRTPLLEAEYHLFKNKNRIAEVVVDFLKTSIKVQERKGLIWRIIAFVSISFSLVCLALVLAMDIDLDDDFNKAFGLKQLNVVDWSLIYIPILLMFLHAIVLKVKGLLRFETIKFSVLVWGIILLLYLFCLIYNASDLDVVMSISILAVFPSLIVFGSYLKELKRRISWRRKYVPYRFGDDFIFKFKTVSITGLIVVLVFSSSVLYIDVLSTKNEKLQERDKLAYILLDGLDRIQERLSYSDIKYVNDLWKDYLIENFKEELSDTICDPKELELARCLYNLHEPVEALTYLYPDENWHHHFLWILCQARAGKWDDAAHALELYVDGNRYDELGPHSTTDFIWLAEKMGRFDLAEKLVEIVKDTVPNNLEQYAMKINRGHIYLYRNDYKRAEELYQSAISDWVNSGNPPMGLNIYIERDFHTFSRFGAMDDTKLERMSHLLNLDFTPAFITDVDSVTHVNTLQKLNGSWVCQLEQGQIILHIDAENNLFTYELYDINDNLINRFLAESRISYRDGALLWDEYNLITDENTLGRFVEISKDSFVVEVIENGNPEDKGIRNKYVRCMNEFE